MESTNEYVKTDGDGLSDMCTIIDPQDGKLRFDFDCGGWQTEGWVSNGKLSNISGRKTF